MTYFEAKSPNRRDFSLLALAGLSVLAAGVRPLSAGEPLSEQQARAALDPWIEAVYSGDPTRVDGVLGPEFQILRSDGTGHDKAGYLKALPKHNAPIVLSDIIATGNADVMVIRYRIDSDQTVDGKAAKGNSPRLSVFRKEDGRWLLSAHANFAPLT
ncbi:nuclear transport factor 2 family protein [Mesorhizobium sp. ZMM04-5]|uniref:Nuclear transport factor 2 family protein n=2 Tax=Mesorhizobium marinum TaxID=3228790 RepID=A0ABV3R2T0_9HYPH